MNIKQLESLCAFADTLSFTEAAEKIFLSQPAFSREIAALEKELGCPLIIRSRKEPRLTLAGEQIVRSARSILAESNHIRKIAEFEKMGNMGVLRIGVLTDGMSPAVVMMFKEFCEKNPDIKFDVSEYAESELLQAIEREKVDFGIVIHHQDHTKIDEKLFEMVLLDRCEHCVVMNEMHPLANRKSITFSELRNEEFILLNPEIINKGYDFIVQKSLENGFLPKIVKYVDSTFSLATYINFNLGLSVQPSSVTPYFGPCVTFVPVEDLNPVEYHLIHLKSKKNSLMKKVITEMKK